MGARVEIEYCTQCRWLLRAAWMAQELLSTFDAVRDAVARARASGMLTADHLQAEGLWVP